MRRSPIRRECDAGASELRSASRRFVDGPADQVDRAEGRYAQRTSGQTAQRIGRRQVCVQDVWFDSAQMSANCSPRSDGDHAPHIEECRLDALLAQTGERRTPVDVVEVSNRHLDARRWRRSGEIRQQHLSAPPGERIDQGMDPQGAPTHALTA